MILNGEDMSTGGRPLQPAVYGAILRALGITATTPADVRAALANAAASGSFPNANGGMIPGIGGYAVGYGTTIPYILLAGVDLQEAHFAPDTVDPGDPEVSADEVVDRATLKRFVNGADRLPAGALPDEPPRHHRNREEHSEKPALEKRPHLSLHHGRQRLHAASRGVPEQVRIPDADANLARPGDRQSHLAADHRGGESGRR